MQYNLSRNIVTIFGVGKIKYAQGTIGSLIALPLCFLIIYCVSQVSLVNIPMIGAILSIIVFFIGIVCTDEYIKPLANKDPSEVIIDELSGQMLAIFLTYPSINLIPSESLQVDARYLPFLISYFSPFILFRIFDIFKPWPINWVDANIKNGLGVMLDDLLAAIAAIITHYLFLTLMFNLSWQNLRFL